MYFAHPGFRLPMTSEWRDLVCNDVLHLCLPYAPTRFSYGSCMLTHSFRLSWLLQHAVLKRKPLSFCLRLWTNGTNSPFDHLDWIRHTLWGCLHMTSRNNGVGAVPCTIQNDCSWTDTILKSGSMPYYFCCGSRWSLMKRKFVACLTATPGRWSRSTGGRSSTVNIYDEQWCVKKGL